VSATARSTMTFPRLLSSSVMALVAAVSACASGSRAPQLAPPDPRCAAVSDSLSKYISADALPLAHLEGSPRTLPVPRTMQPGDSVEVDFVVLPTGVADTSTVSIVGDTDAQFARSALQFATESRFSPAQISGCNVLSRYNLIVKPRQAG
jgi:hypothetical protein